MEIGSVLGNRYEIEAVLGEGGFSKVYLAVDRERGRKWAVKELDKGRLMDGRLYQMLKNEAELVQRLDYPYFPHIEERIEGQGRCYIVMEYLKGETLEDMLKRRGPIPPGEVAKWGRDMCLVLGYLHQLSPPLVYQDMKPGNIVRQPGGNLRLIDFGAVWGWAGKDGEIRLGTKGYAAPEQMERDGAIDARTDIYGLGATMYRLLTGADVRKFPAGDYHARHWNRLVPRRLDKVIWKCTRANPKERYQSCGELEKELWKEIKNRTYV